MDSLIEQRACEIIIPHPDQITWKIFFFVENYPISNMFTEIATLVKVLRQLTQLSIVNAITFIPSAVSKALDHVEALTASLLSGGLGLELQ